ncbi:hypothetical protein HY501_02190 [Candidatus Woesearchaeota archaeon]|nr:hypothetical protein [Candidatus Woesearchaeota archaeon]
MILNKEGASHADWAISLGIFLVYTLVLFLVVQPGTEPVFKEENLLQIVRVHFENATNYRLERTLLIINVSTSPTDTPAGVFRLTAPFTGEFEEDFLINRRDLGDAPAGEREFDMVFNPTSVTIDLGDPLLSPASATPAQNYSEYEVYHAAVSFPTPADPGAGEIILPDEMYTFGPTEVLDGINKNVISNTNPIIVNFPCADQAEYDALKAAWGYPASKEFSIYVVAGSSPVYDIAENVSVCAVARPYDQASVFVDEYASWVLDEYGNRFPVRVNIKVW